MLVGAIILFVIAGGVCLLVDEDDDAQLRCANTAMLGILALMIALIVSAAILA